MKKCGQMKTEKKMLEIVKIGAQESIGALMECRVWVDKSIVLTFVLLMRS